MNFSHVKLLYFSNYKQVVILIQRKARWENLLLAYKTLGVVFGGLVTSPLYVYPSMPLKSPTEDDYLGIYSIMFWTLTLIGVVKYASIALKADDQGEGTNRLTFSLRMLKSELHLCYCLPLIYIYMHMLSTSVIPESLISGTLIACRRNFCAVFITLQEYEYWNPFFKAFKSK